MALIAHTSAVGTGGAAPATSSAIDTTGATLLVIMVTDYINSSATDTVTDSKGNTWLHLTNQNEINAGAQGVIWYAINPIVGTGHTFTVVGNYPGVCIAAFSGIDTNSFDVENGFHQYGFSFDTIQPGSITPSQAGELVISGTGIFGSAGFSPTVDSSFIVTDVIAQVGGVNLGVGLAYIIQGSAAAVNPTWTVGTGSSFVSSVAVIASFKAAPSGGGVVANLIPQSIGDEYILGSGDF